MNPALSVIFFTTLSGAGYGVLFWAAYDALFGQAPARPLLWSVALALILSTIGLLSSMLHLGKPARAWRAFSQWRTSWLSREGVAAMATFGIAVLLAVALLPSQLAGEAWGGASLSLPGKLVAALAIAAMLLTVRPRRVAIAQNSSPPVNNANSTYTRGTSAWRHAGMGLSEA